MASINANANKKSATTAPASPAGPGLSNPPTTTPTGKSASTTETKVTHEQIAQAAYAKWKKRGGDAFVNWLEAERELKTAGSAR